MKIPTIEQIRLCDANTIQYEPISSIDLMERAAKSCVEQIKRMFSSDMPISVFCGTGNNGGDGLAIARLLLDSGYQCQAFLLYFGNTCSTDCKENLLRLQKTYPDKIQIITNKEEIPILFDYRVIIDALLGSGLNKPVENEIFIRLIKRINASPAFVFSVDMPSGLFAEIPMDANAVAVEADFTLSFQFPKLGFLFPENYKYVGEWTITDIGLHPCAIEQIQSNNHLISGEMVRGMLHLREKFVHKANFGHGLLVAGSKGMMGAAVLSAKACLRSGIGLLTAHVPAIGYTIMQSNVPEAMCVCDKEENFFSGIDFDLLAKYNAIAIGPGLGKNKRSAEGLKKLIADFGGSIIFDADAINLLSENKTWLEFIPPNCILTPHIKEFERLTHPVSNSFERMELQREFSFRHQCTIVLKGAHTCISSQQGDCYFNTSGNPGMATGGSGDVLTGIILGLLAQRYTAIQAAITGVFLHGKAADIALKHQSCESLIASDIIDNTGLAFLSV
ncbi:MAG: NAD(P)H-hydrate dehydratase [Bacteroidales bacterium]|jgi:NAD(P)H-hydrate epimerase|nr:NAD(P)H-hydrate dehydratase [Bacteroidales bacterium]